MQNETPSILHRKAGHQKKKGGRPMKHKDQQGKAIPLLLWGKKGWKRYKGLRHSGFSIEDIFEFLREKKEAEKRGDI